MRINSSIRCLLFLAVLSVFLTDEKVFAKDDKILNENLSSKELKENSYTILLPNDYEIVVLDPKLDSVVYYINSGKITLGGLYFGNHPSEPESYMIELYRGIDGDWIEKFKNNTQIDIPHIYQNLLLQINGFFIFDISLYGLTPSIYAKGLLDRKMLQCQSLDDANTQWIREFKVSNTYFHIGGRSYSDEENIGYFIIDNKIQTILENGKIINEYKNIKDFLTEEIKIAEEMYLEENDIEELK
ncbi:hypothetical protein FACS1894103_6410 [Campylobacterota bacterium]|nr:hypothetical protein FACS1894103_6410 [Campylobacterota bacterium]